MPDNPIFDPTEEQRKILKNYIGKLKTPDDLHQMLTQPDDRGSSVMDSPTEQAMYKAAHGNMSPENMVMGMGMPAIGMIRNGNVLNIMEELAAKKAAMPNANVAVETSMLNDAKSNAVEHSIRNAADLARKNALFDPIEYLRARLDTDVPSNFDILRNIKKSVKNSK